MRKTRQVLLFVLGQFARDEIPLSIKKPGRLVADNLDLGAGKPRRNGRLEEPRIGQVGEDTQVGHGYEIDLSWPSQ